MKNIILSIALILIGITTMSAQTEKQKTVIRADITKVMTDQAEAWNRGDVEGFMQGYWKSEQLIFVSSEVTRGWQQTLDRYKKSYDTREKMGTLKFSDLEIDVLSKDAAMVLGSWEVTTTKGKSGGKFTLIFRKFKDGWKVVHDHTS